MNKRGEAKATVIIIIFRALIWLTQWYRIQADRIDAVNQSREFCLEQASSLRIAWHEDLGQCQLADKLIQVSTIEESN